MRAIRAMFVAIATIQKAAGNPCPRLIALAALSGQIFAPIYCIVEKFNQNKLSVVAISAGISCFVIFLITRSVVIHQLFVKDMNSFKIKFFIIFFISTVVLAGIAKFSPELSIATYLAFSFLPIQRLLKPRRSDDIT